MWSVNSDLFFLTWNRFGYVKNNQSFWIKFNTIYFYSGNGVECRCPVGYNGNGIGPDGCQGTGIVTSYCLNKVCKNSGTCVISLSGMPACLCAPGYTGLICIMILIYNVIVLYRYVFLYVRITIFLMK